MAHHALIRRCLAALLLLPLSPFLPAAAAFYAAGTNPAGMACCRFKAGKCSCCRKATGDNPQAPAWTANYACENNCGKAASSAPQGGVLFEVAQANFGRPHAYSELQFGEQLHFASPAYAAFLYQRPPPSLHLLH